jgi:1-acyl-sn-glycerol-3-phosphate acyltransferase
LTPLLWLLTRRTWAGMEHLPATGGMIIAVNHVSDADPPIVAHFVYDAGRWPQFMGKVSLFKVPVLGYMLRVMRQIPVHRGTVDAIKALHSAIEAIEGGGTVVIYPEGTTTMEPNLWPMRAKTGVARLWLATGAPVVPVVMWGPQQIFDVRTEKLRLRPRAPMTVVAGPPVDLSRWTGAEPNTQNLNDITEAIMLRLRDMLADVRQEEAPPLYSPNRRKSDAKGSTTGNQSPAAEAKLAAADAERSTVDAEDVV